jgi:hypothetical protein
MPPIAPAFCAIGGPMVLALGPPISAITIAAM